VAGLCSWQLALSLIRAAVGRLRDRLEFYGKEKVYGSIP
jgi:hypothetical protein